MHHAFRLGDADHRAELSRSATGYRLHLDGATLDVASTAGDRCGARLVVDGREYAVVVTTHGDDVFIHLDGETHALRHQGPLQRLAAQSGGAGGDGIRAPMPGSIVSVAVKAGDAVVKGQTLLVMESMKMETTIAAPRNGTVAEVAYEAAGQTFERDALLLSLEPVENPA